MKETPSVPPRRLEIIGERDLGSTVAESHVASVMRSQNRISLPGREQPDLKCSEFRGRRSKPLPPRSQPGSPEDCLSTV